MSGGLGSGAGRWRAFAAELLARLTLAQRAAIAAVAVLGLGAIVWVVVEGRRVQYVVVPLPAAAAEADALKQRIFTAGVQWRPSSVGSGAEIEIAHSDLARVRELLDDDGVSVEDDPEVEESGRLFPARLSASEIKLRAAIKEVERAISSSARVRSAQVTPHLDPRELRALDPARGSASVFVVLAPGVERLRAYEAETFRAQVAAALGLSGEIVISDQFVRRYEPTPDAGRELLEDDIRAKILSLYGDRFAAGEDFQLIVTTSRAGDERTRGGLVHALSSEGSAAEPAAGPRSGAVAEPGASPRGSVQPWEPRVRLRFDSATICRALNAPGPSSDEVGVWLDSELETVETLLGPGGGTVVVELAVLRMAAAPEAVPAAAAPLPTPAAAGFDEFWAALLGRADELPGGRRTAAAGLFLVGALALATLLARARTRRRRARAASTPPVVPAAAVARGPDAALEAQDLNSRKVSERPQAAVAVLRLWMSEDAAVEEPEAAL